ncbi:MAG: hypothetical protein K2G14_03460, partial [Ruminococcus sp.]|nr:hypothetical protein [Ruminococcus sp.]
IIFFYLSLVPVIVSVIFFIIGIIYGDVEEVMGGIFMIVPAIFFLKRGINPDILYVIAFFVLVFQIVAIGNFIRVRKKVREYKENHEDDEK